MSYTKFRNLQVKDLQTLGNTVLGDASTDTITVTARVASSVVPSTTNTRDLGSSSLKWKDLYVAGTATLATVDINAGNLDGVTIGAEVEGPITGTTITANEGFFGNITGDVTGNVSGTAGGIASSARFTATGTGTGSEQSIAHGLGVVPGLAWLIPTNAGGAPFPIVEGTHDSTNLKFTVPSGVTYRVCAIK